MNAAVAAAAGAFAGGLVAGIISQWRAARIIIRTTQDEYNQPVPYWPITADELSTAHTEILAGLCFPCNNRSGDCICTAQCGHDECVGGFDDDTVAFLRGLTQPKGPDQ